MITRTQQKKHMQKEIINCIEKQQCNFYNKRAATGLYADLLLLIIITFNKKNCNMRFEIPLKQYNGRSNGMRNVQTIHPMSAKDTLISFNEKNTLSLRLL